MYRCTENMSQGTIGFGILKQECDFVKIKTEAGEVLSLKEENANDKEDTSNDCKTGALSEVFNAVGGDVKEETRSITDDTDRNGLLYVEYEFSVPITKELHYTQEDTIIKEEHALETFKTEEYLNETKFKGYKTSFNVDKLLDATSGTPLNSTTKKPKSTKDRSRNLSKHKRAYSRKKPFGCNVCDFKATCDGSLTRHLRVHTGEKPFCCNVCDFKTSCNGSLKRHMRIHTGEKPFRCNVCEFSASHKVSLNNHLLSHSDEKPYRCNICDFNFTRKVHLVQHMRTHTGEKPFGCDICDFRAACKSSLIRHKRIHTGEKPFRCNFCHLSMSRKGDLVRHMRTHTGEKPYQCNVCEFTAARKGSLIKHMQKHS